MAGKLKIRKAGVIGAGVMGSGISAHLANCGIPTILLDIVPKDLSEDDKARGIKTSSPEFRNKFALKALDAMRKARLSPLYDIKDIELIEPGNLEDHFDRLKEVDWIIEVVVERLDVKRQLFEHLEAIHREGQIISSNTSGIALERILEGRGETFQEHTLITHFFNPPRYMYLLEIIPGAHTRSELLEEMVVFGERVLGKGVVIGKDTPNFVANRIGGFDFSYAIKLARELKLNVEETDMICGTLIGRPKTGLFRLMDLIGLDVAVHVNRNLYESVPNDESREVFQPDPLIEKLVARGSLGDKVQEGFYKKVKGEDGKSVILALDFETLEYKPSQSPDLPSVKEAKRIYDLGERLRFLVGLNDKVGKFVWALLSSTLCYAANRIPEISDDIFCIDNALKWGYAWEMGPFEIWDALGVKTVVKRMEQEEQIPPSWVKEMLKKGCARFYDFTEGVRTYYDVAKKTRTPLPERAGTLMIADKRDVGKVIRTGKTASIIDLDDGVICLEIHSKVNALGREVIELINEAIKETEENYQALVITGRGPHFSVGADLSEAMGAMKQGQWGIFEEMVRNFQNMTSALQYARVPTIAALYGRALGGGCEMSMHCDRIQASCETYIGLVEIGVGLIPGGGGCREWAIRSSEMSDAVPGTDLFHHINQALQTIGMAKVSTSGADARKIGYLRASDGISRNRDSLLYDAKMAALQLAGQGYRPPMHRTAIRVLGENGIAEFKVRLNIFRQSGYITEYDEFVANKIAYILCGGNVPSNSTVDEQRLLDLELEAFLSLLGEPKTHTRITHMLKTGKPLRN